MKLEPTNSAITYDGVYVGSTSSLNTIERYASTSMIFKRPVMDWEEIQIR